MVVFALTLRMGGLHVTTTNALYLYKCYTFRYLCKLSFYMLLCMQHDDTKAYFEYSKTKNDNSNNYVSRYINQRNCGSGLCNANVGSSRKLIWHSSFCLQTKLWAIHPRQWLATCNYRKESLQKTIL